MRTIFTATAIGLMLAGTLTYQAYSSDSHSTHMSGGTMSHSGGAMSHSGGAMHSEMTMGTEAILPTEGGQSAFTAIAEIVVLLKGDPQTDWSKVNIGELRAHLVDMNELTLNAVVETTTESNKVVFRISGAGRTLRAIQAMVPAHSAVLSAANLYDADAESTGNGALMRVAFSSESEKQEILALGFFGIMATGAHHQDHHLQMAKGNGHFH